jgi:cation-transporting ATPase E
MPLRTDDAATTAALPGLSTAEVASRTAAGQVNRAPAPPSRTVGQIARANVFTTFNAVLGGLCVLALVVAPPQDALFGLVIVWNTLIGIVQEVRAKRTLDRLTLLSAPQVRVRRDGEVVTVTPEAVVLGDLVVLGPGDQVVVDAEVVAGDHLEVDESLLTGESEPQVRRPGDRLLSGSFVVAGTGLASASAVGAEAYAARLAAQARRFQLTRSDLQAGIDGVLRWVGVAIVPASLLLVRGQVAAGLPWREAAQRSVAGVVHMVPEGLVLLTSIAFAVGVVRLGRRHCLVKELPAVEGLARVSVVCLDKTGTLTDGAIALQAVEPVADLDEAAVRAVLAAVAAADPAPNATLAAIAAATQVGDGAVAPGRVGGAGVGGVGVVDRVPFSSARKWSGVRFAGGEGWVLGAPELLIAAGHPALARAGALAAEGRRVVALCRAPAGAWPEPAGEAEVVALVVLEERLRPDAPSTVAYFLAQGVTLRVISGDNPETVGAVAARAGVPGAEDPVDARHLPDDPDALAEVLAVRSVYGRVRPEQKRAMVAALQRNGHTVAMTGDGVNDVLALKDADLGIAMGSGSAATRAVAQVVLLDGRFASLPEVVAEGRRVLANIERVASLFLTKTVYAVVLAVAVGLAGVPYPFLPRHLTVVAAVGIGIPGFFLALAPASQRARPGFVRRVVRFVALSGPLAAATVLATSAAVGTGEADRAAAHTAALAVLLGVSLVVLAEVIRPFTPARWALWLAMVGLSVAALALPPSREVLALTWPGRGVALLVAVLTAAAAVVLAAARRWGGVAAPASSPS